MPADTDIANMALSRLGTRATIADLSENSTEARQINLWYATVRDDLQSLVDWNFNRVSQALAASGHPAGALGLELRLSVGLPEDAAARFRRRELGRWRPGERLRDRVGRQRHLPLLQRGQGLGGLRPAGDRSGPLHAGLRPGPRRLPRRGGGTCHHPEGRSRRDAGADEHRSASSAPVPTVPTKASRRVMPSGWRRAWSSAISTGWETVHDDSDHPAELRRRGTLARRCTAASISRSTRSGWRRA